jgi:hypothetical protein
MKTEQVECLVLKDEDLPWGKANAETKKRIQEHDLVIYVDPDGLAQLVKCKHGQTKNTLLMG